jgi:MYXO-CTERM domain-containing protein
MLSWRRVPALAAPIYFLACAPGPEPQAEEVSAAVEVNAGSVTPTAAAFHGPATLGAALADDTGAHLAISLVVEDNEGVAELLRNQQDPSSARYHAWLTPQQYGDRFGVPQATYTRIVNWLSAEGFEVTGYPSRLFVDATGTVRKVRDALGVQLRTATHNGRTFRSHAEDALLPDDIAPFVAKIGGLDTRPRLRPRMEVGVSGGELLALGAGDLRTQYDIPGAAPGAAGLTLAVLGTQEGTWPKGSKAATPPWVQPDAQAIQTYFTTESFATATYNPIGLPNPDDDFDVVGANSEFELDVEMQSVAAPNAQTIDLVLSPASVVLQTGAQYIVNTLSHAVIVSLSLGTCEAEEVAVGGEVTDPKSDGYQFQQTLRQGLAEGQTWFASSGDTGADGCDNSLSGTNNGYDGGNATVEFPCSLPEIVCVGGTMFNARGSWSSNGDLTAYAHEVVCNEGSSGVAAGGGQSLLYTKPTWQEGVGPEATDGSRDVPDLALMAASATPGVAVYTCGEGQDACAGTGYTPAGIAIVGGTSVASPLAAGIFASLAGDVGCKLGLGDIHATLYALGAAQQSGGAAPFHDITSGNNSFPDPKHQTITGFTAGPGYDLASGWGSLDVAKLVSVWPSCSPADGGTAPPEDAGSKEPEPDASLGTGGRDAGEGVPDAGEGVPDAGEGVPDAGTSLLDAGLRIYDAGASVADAGEGADAGGGGHGSEGFPEAGVGAPEAGVSLPDSGEGNPDAGAGELETGSVADAAVTEVPDSSTTQDAGEPASSSDGGAGEGGGTSTSPGSSGSSGGCSCGLGGTEPSRGWLGGAVAVGLVALCRRRRRQARGNPILAAP